MENLTIEKKEEGESTIEKIEHAVVDTLTATKDLVGSVLTAIVGGSSENPEMEKEQLAINKQPDLRTEEERFKASLHKTNE